MSVMKYLLAIGTSLLLSISSLINAETIIPEEIPSAELHELARVAPERFMNLHTSIEYRLDLLTGVWVRANRSHSIDNRAYLFALAIDLYNSLPPDLVPPEPPRESWPEEGDGPDLSPYKEQWAKEMYRFNINLKKPVKERNSQWAWMKQNLKPKQFAVAIEVEYIKHFIRKQIEQGNIVFDDRDAPASMDAEQIDILNPTHYQAIKTYVDKNKILMEQRGALPF